MRFGTQSRYFVFELRAVTSNTTLGAGPSFHSLYVRRRSGLLFNSHLIMYDRRDNETLYPQIYFTGISISNIPSYLVPEYRLICFVSINPNAPFLTSGI